MSFHSHNYRACQIWLKSELKKQDQWKMSSEVIFNTALTVGVWIFRPGLEWISAHMQSNKPEDIKQFCTSKTFN